MEDKEKKKDSKVEELPPVTYEDVREWVLANSDDTESMDEINRLTYLFTSTYKAKKAKKEF